MISILSVGAAVCRSTAYGTEQLGESWYTPAQSALGAPEMGFQSAANLAKL